MSESPPWRLRANTKRGRRWPSSLLHANAPVRYLTDISPSEPPGNPAPFPRLTIATHAGRIIIYLNASEKLVDTSNRCGSADFSLRYLDTASATISATSRTSVCTVPRARAFLQSGQAVTIVSAPVASSCAATARAICNC